MVVECKPEKAYKNLILFLEPCEEQGELLRTQRHLSIQIQLVIRRIVPGLILSVLCAECLALL
jgi:hypothetical protein